MKRVLKLIILLLLILLNFFVLNYFIVREYIPVKDMLNKINLKEVKSLMIIAHPDDESLWGGAHLAKQDYLVVCVTCGSDEKRKKEFEKAMNEFGNKYMSLGYPDKTNNEKDDWSKIYYKIEKDIKYILNYKKWDMIVTHNPEGEYNHIHHKMVSTMVSKNADKDRLYYFNRYYTSDELTNMDYCIRTLDDKDIYRKNIMLPDYESQQQIIDNHYLNIKYEQFISYKNWN